MSLTGAIIGALAGVCAVLLFRISQNKENSARKDEPQPPEKKKPVRIEYKK
jgi:gas vesicle protein